MGTNIELDSSYKLLKRLNPDQLDEAYQMLVERFGKISKLQKTSDSANKKIVLVGFDGIIHNATSWEDPLIILKEPIPGSFQWLETLIHNDEYKVIIFSPRCKYKGFSDSLINWCKKHRMPEDMYNRLECTSVLISCHTIIDINTFPLNGKLHPTIKEIDSFNT